MSTFNEQLHLLRLIEKDAKEGGWAKVSAAVWPLLADIQDGLIEREPLPEGGGRVRLTADGIVFLRYI